MALTLFAAPAEEPLSVAELKAWVRVTHSAEDALLGSIIKSCRAKAENYTERVLIAQTWDQTLDAFPEAQIELLQGPAQSITSVSYVDEDGVQQTLAGAAYTLDKRRFPDWLLPAYDTSWPATQASANAVSIRYVCGYANAAAVPDDIKQWLLLTGAFLYKNREAFVIGGKVGEIPGRFLDTLLDPYRMFKA